MGFNLAVILRESAQSSPDRPVAVFDGGSLTYRALDHASDRLAAALTAAGIKPGDPVALQLPNIPQFLISYFGILGVGGRRSAVGNAWRSGAVDAERKWPPAQTEREGPWLQLAVILREARNHHRTAGGGVRRWRYYGSWTGSDRLRRLRGVSPGPVRCTATSQFLSYSES